MPRFRLSALTLALLLPACSGGNLQSASSRHGSGPATPPVRHPYFDAYAALGDVPATWVAPLRDRIGIERPLDPVITNGLIDYGSAPWSISRPNPAAPPGTY